MKKKIHEFANFYFDIFRDPKATNFQVEEGFAEKCSPWVSKWIAETPSARDILKPSTITPN